MADEQEKFEGWALIELYGHAREAGYVSTAYFGPAAMFRVEVPEIPARQETLSRPQWLEGKLCPAGTVVEAEAIPGRTRFLGPGSIYSMNPASEEAVRAAIASMVQRDVKVISISDGAQPQLVAATDAEYPDGDELEEDEDF